MAKQSVATSPRRRRQYIRQAGSLRPSEFWKFNQLEGRRRHEVLCCDVCGGKLAYTDGVHGEYEFTFANLPYHVHAQCVAALDDPEARKEILLTRAGLHSEYWRSAVEIMLATVWFGEQSTRSGAPC